jgi:hypothetical protein
VTATRQAEVGAADPQPAVGGGVGDHRLHQLAVRLLDGVALGEGAPRLGEPPGERVTHLLQLPQVEHPRRTRGGDPVRHVNAAEPVGDQPGQLPLEPPDLPAQLRPGRRLAGEPSVLGSPLGDQGQSVGLR